MSGQSLAQFGLLARLRSRRGIAGLTVILLVLAGGWYFFLNEGPQSASAMYKTQSADAKGKAAARKGAAAASDSAVVATPTTLPVPQPIPLRAPTPIVVEHVTDPLGSTYADAEHGFSIRFPAAWPIRTFAAQPWVLDCGDANSGMISIGFSPCPVEVTADHLLPEGIARRIKKRPGTKLLGQGKTQIGGRKALWFKSTGPMPLTSGSPVMTRVQYIVPLGDGRVLELRVAAPPQKFDALADAMKNSVDTLEIRRK